ncbi:MAG: HAD family hydrolase [Candidatus Hodarchaeales archaeon]
MKINSVIFDVDGTLVDNSRIIVKIFQDIVKEYLDKEMSDKEVLSYWGPPGDEIFRQVFPGDIVEEAWNVFLYRYERFQPEKGFFSLKQLEKLRDHVNFMSIFTGKSRDTLEITLKKLEWERLFDLVVTGTDIERSKPYPDGLFHIISALNLDKQETIFLGDSHLDIMAGKAAGVITAAALWGTLELDKLLDAGPDYQFKTPEEFIEFVTES